MAPPASGPNAGVSSTGGMLVSTARVRRAGARRRGVDARPEAAALDRRGRAGGRRGPGAGAWFAALRRGAAVRLFVSVPSPTGGEAARVRLGGALVPAARPAVRAPV